MTQCSYSCFFVLLACHYLWALLVAAWFTCRSRSKRGGVCTVAGVNISREGNRMTAHLGHGGGVLLEQVERPGEHTASGFVAGHQHGQQIITELPRRYLLARSYQESQHAWVCLVDVPLAKPRLPCTTGWLLLISPPGSANPKPEAIGHETRRASAPTSIM